MSFKKYSTIDLDLVGDAVPELVSEGDLTPNWVKNGGKEDQVAKEQEQEEVVENK